MLNLGLMESVDWLDFPDDIKDLFSKIIQTIGLSDGTYSFWDLDPANDIEYRREDNGMGCLTDAQVDEISEYLLQNLPKDEDGNVRKGIYIHVNW